MHKLRSSCRWIVGTLALATVAALPSSTPAAAVTLNIQSISSSVTLSGSISGLTYVQQNAGSLTTNWSGTINADLTGGIFTFSGGSTINPVVNPNGPYDTAPNPIGIEAGNYGVTASGTVVALGGFVTVNGVYKNLLLDITAGTAQNGVAPTGVTMKFNAPSALDFGLQAPGGPLFGTSNLTGSGLNTSAALVGWDGTTLTLPVTFQTTGGSARIENWNGTITATLVAVPEPTTIALLGLLGMGGVAGAFYRRRRLNASLEQSIHA